MNFGACLGACLEVSGMGVERLQPLVNEFTIHVSAVMFEPYECGKL
jgi:hypothetical protein